MATQFPVPTPAGSSTIIQAIANGTLPPNTEIAGFGQGSQTIMALLATNAISANALCSTLVYASPNANYAGT
jgi:hypothetical protein